jgi:hypothetical protein
MNDKSLEKTTAWIGMQTEFGSLPEKKQCPPGAGEIKALRQQGNGGLAKAPDKIADEAEARVRAGFNRVRDRLMHDFNSDPDKAAGAMPTLVASSK